MQRLLRSGTVQAKLTVSQPGDPYEREADRVADRVTRMPTPTVQRACACGGTCAACSDEELPLLQRKTETTAGNSSTSALGSVIPSGGRSPDRGTRSFFEPRLGHDLGGVRMHAGAEAAALAQSLGAKAYTVGRDVVFGEGQYQPRSAAGRRLLAHELVHVVQQARAPTPTIQRQGLFDFFSDEKPLTAEKGISEALSRMEEERTEAEEALAKIQGHAMFALLPALQALPARIRSHELAGLTVGGPRLVTAMHVVQAQGSSWLDFAASHNGELAALPPDQIANVMTFLGAPAQARYYTAEHFGGRFDGAVDPNHGVVLFQRVKLVLTPGVRFGQASPGTPGWEEETSAGFKKFKADYKRVIENAWSGKGSIQPVCPVPGIGALSTRVVVSVVESGEHNVIHIHRSEASGRSNQGDKRGNLKADDNLPVTHNDQVVDPTGTKPEQVTTTQIPSTHEFGHSIGLNHPHCPGRDTNCYGVTAEERQDIMGAGDKLQVITRGGKVRHDDFAPFTLIAKKWGSEIFPGALAKCNEWSAG